MNAHEPFPGTGMQQPYTEDEIEEQKAQQARLFEVRLSSAKQASPDDLMSEALAEDLAKELPTQSLIAGKIGLFQRSIAEALFEKRKQQEIVTLANAKIRQLTISMQADEAALDALLASES